MKKFSTYYWKFIMGMIVLTSLITVFVMNQGSSLLAKDGEVVLFVSLMVLLIMFAEQWNEKTWKDSPLFVLGEMMFALMLTPIFFVSYRYVTSVLSLGWLLHLSRPANALLWLIGMLKIILVLMNTNIALFRAIQFLKVPYKKNMI